MDLLRQYLLAIQSFTRVPVDGALAHLDGDEPPASPVPASAANFPGVGWFVGLVACTVLALVGLALPGSPFSPLAAAIACIAAATFMTGAAHEDGLARVAGALAPGVRRTPTVDAHFDSRLGIHGVIAVVLVLLAKMSLIAVLAGHSPAAALAGLFTAQVVSRFWPVFMVRGMSYLGESGAATQRPFAQPVGKHELWVALGWCAVPLALTWWGQGLGFVLVGLLVSGVVLALLRSVFVRRLQGFNDACVGATQQLCEVGFYLGAAIGLGA